MVVDIETIFSDHLAGQKFQVREIEIDDRSTSSWVRVLVNPVRFVPEVFSGNWAAPNRHPSSGRYRVLAVVDCHDGLARAVVRDGKYLYATPFV